MPACKFFLEGLCARDDCPYRHVKVNADAEICPDYLRGHCSKGQECRLRHVSRCPQFERTGACPKGARCPYPHRKKEDQAKVLKRRKCGKTPPAKPKRKSLVGTPAATPSTGEEDRRTRGRYFDRDHLPVEPASAEETAAATDDGTSSSTSNTLEAKRKRLFRKVELAKQGWTGVAVSAEKNNAKDDSKLDDSGPYEEIPDEDEADAIEESRTPLGDLPSYIPLDSSPSGDTNVREAVEVAPENEEVDERLI
jgi:hypothetical protein